MAAVTLSENAPQCVSWLKFEMRMAINFDLDLDLDLTVALFCVFCSVSYLRR